MSGRCLASLLLALGLLAASGSRAADALVFGTNAGVSTADRPWEVESRFRPLADMLAKALRQPVGAVAVRSTEVGRAVAERRADFLFIHTHAALEAHLRQGWQMVAQTRQERDNRIRILLSPHTTASSLKEIDALRLALPGPQSFVTAMAVAALRTNGIDPDRLATVEMKTADMACFMLTAGFADAAAVRSDRLAQECERGGARLVLEGKPGPVYAVVAAPRLAQTLVDTAREALMRLDRSPGGPELLEAIGIAGFAPVTEKDVPVLMAWLRIEAATSAGVARRL